MAVSYSKFIDYLFWKSRDSAVPMSGTFELTARCNLDCRMCYIHKRANDSAVRKEELTAQQWLDLAKAAQRKGMLLLLLTGGEPFLRPDFREIYTGCRKLGLLMSINSNGTMITDEMVEYLKIDAPLRVNITLYGASPETYERLCGDASAFDRAYHAVLALKKAGIRVKLNYSATPENIQDISKVYAFAKEHDIMIQTASYMFPPVRACENSACSICRLTPQQSAQARWDYDVFRFGEKNQTLRADAIRKGSHVPDPDSECQELPTERIRCRAGSTTFWVTYKGEMRPCGMMSEPTVNVLAKGFDASWDKTREEREKILLPAKCSICTMREICEFCPAACYAETGCFTETPDYICEKTKAYYEIAERWLCDHEPGGMKE